MESPMGMVVSQPHQQFFTDLSSSDDNLRREAFNAIKRQFLECVSLFKCPAPTARGQDSGDILSYVRLYSPKLYFLSLRCPLDDVRENCKLILDFLEEQSIWVRELKTTAPSSFIPQSEVVPVDTSDSRTKMLFVEAFLQNHRLDNLTQILGFHPQYLSCFLKTQNLLLREEGPLPFDQRHYIAIIAAARHQCSYIVNIHTKEYIRHKGDPRWLESLNNVPEKLKSLQEINRLLAHRPWLVSRSHIDSLCKLWSLSELMHAIVLMAHFHAMCSAVYGCGINYEQDDSSCQPVNSDGESSSDSEGEGYTNGHQTIESLLEQLKKVEPEDYSEEEGLLRFRTIESITAELHAKSTPMNGSRASTAHLVEQPDFTYVDFVKREEVHIQTLRASDFNWEAQGFGVASGFLEKVGNLLDEKFKVAKRFTYYTMGDKYTDVNTDAFRTAIWNYIHCIMGIMHDDYNYALVNHLLERSLKSFTKLMTCYPEQVTKKDFEGVMKGFKYSEKIHVNIILLEARMQAELLYALRAVSQYMT